MAANLASEDATAAALRNRMSQLQQRNATGLPVVDSAAAQDIPAKAAAAVSILLNRIEGGPGKTEGTVLATRLVERESVRVL